MSHQAVPLTLVKRQGTKPEFFLVIPPVALCLSAPLLYRFCLELMASLVSTTTSFSLWPLGSGTAVSNRKSGLQLLLVCLVYISWVLQLGAQSSGALQAVGYLQGYLDKHKWASCLVNIGCFAAFSALDNPHWFKKFDVLVFPGRDEVARHSFTVPFSLIAGIYHS